MCITVLYIYILSQASNISENIMRVKSHLSQLFSILDPIDSPNFRCQSHFLDQVCSRLWPMLSVCSNSWSSEVTIPGDFNGDFREVISMVKKENIDCLVETGTMDFYDFPYIGNNME